MREAVSPAAFPPAKTEVGAVSSNGKLFSVGKHTHTFAAALAVSKAAN